MVLSGLKTVDRNARLGNSGETSAVEHGGAAASFLPSGGRALLSLHQILAVHLGSDDQDSLIPLCGSFS
jgi:hypothetical protein